MFYSIYYAYYVVILRCSWLESLVSILVSNGLFLTPGLSLKFCSLDVDLILNRVVLAMFTTHVYDQL